MMALQLDKFQILLSYALWNNNVPNLDIIKNKRVDLFLDSGAFTNFTQGKEIVTLDDYIHFVKENKNWIWNYMNLDVIGDAEKSDYNFEVMKAAGLNPVPVFTRSDLSPKERAKELLKLCANNKFIAIGGVANRLKKTEDRKYLYDTARLIRKHTKTKFHILGCGSMDVLKDIQPYSADSSSPSSHNAFGQIAFWDQRRKQIVAFKKIIKPHNLEKHRRTIQQYRINIDWILNPKFFSPANHDQRSLINLYTFFRMQKYLLKNNIRYFQALPVSYLERFGEMVKHYGL